MADQLNDAISNVVISFVLLLSAFAWLNIVFLKWQKRPILRFEPRRPVPWGAAACLLAILFAAKPFFISSTGTDSDQAASQHPDVALFLLNVIVSELMIAGGFAFFIFAIYHATWRDIGIPARSQQAVRDFFSGLLACAAAIVPVLMIQAMLQSVLHNKSSGHELIKLLTENRPSPAAMAMAAVTVVIVAPICEELAFRLLLQGWLEKWEFKSICRIAHSGAGSLVEAPGTAAEMNIAKLSQPATADGEREDRSLIERPEKGVAGLPFGALPILVSSVVFALAHYGYGPEPIPLFFLAIVLGYLYNRTHRLLPSVVAHAFFNAFALFILWRIQWTGN